jgi:two-component system chemotaxis response regulator CheV
MMVTEYNKRTWASWCMTWTASSASSGTRCGRRRGGPSGRASSRPSPNCRTDGRRPVSILDVEQIMADTFGEPPVGQIVARCRTRNHHIFFVDDSAVARKKIAEVLDQLGVKHKHALNGLEAWTRLSGMAAHAQQVGAACATNWT